MNNIVIRIRCTECDSRLYAQESLKTGICTECREPEQPLGLLDLEEQLAQELEINQ